MIKDFRIVWIFRGKDSNKGCDSGMGKLCHETYLESQNSFAVLTLKDQCDTHWSHCSNSFYYSGEYFQHSFWLWNLGDAVVLSFLICIL